MVFWVGWVISGVCVVQGRVVLAVMCDCVWWLWVGVAGLVRVFMAVAIMVMMMVS